MKFLHIISLTFLIELAFSQYDSGILYAIIKGSNSIFETSTQNNRYQDFNIPFNNHFSSVPQIAFGIMSQEILNDPTQQIGFQITKNEVTRLGLSLRVTCFGTTPLSILTISWIAIIDPQMNIEYQEYTNFPNAGSNTGVRIDLKPYPLTSTTFQISSTTQKTPVLNGYKLQSTSPWNFFILDISTMIQITARQATHLIMLSSFFIYSNKPKSYGSLNWIDYPFSTANIKHLSQPYPQNFGSNQHVIITQAEIYPYNNFLSVEIINLIISPTSFQIDFRTNAYPDVYQVVTTNFMVIQDCIRVFSECNYQGTEIIICDIPSTQVITGAMKSIFLPTGKKIYFAKQETSKQIAIIQKSKKCIYSVSFTSLEVK